MGRSQKRLLAPPPTNRRVKMGQAKARGTFEQRKAVAIARNEALAAEKEAMRIEEKKRISALPESHPMKSRARQRNLQDAILAGMIAASAAG